MDIQKTCVYNFYSSMAVAATAIVRLATLWFAVALGVGVWLGMRPFVVRRRQVRDIDQRK